MGRVVYVLKLGCVGVAFVGHVVSRRELWEVIVVAGRRLGRIVVVFDAVVVGCLVSFVERRPLWFRA